MEANGSNRLLGLMIKWATADAVVGKMWIWEARVPLVFGVVVGWLLAGSEFDSSQHELRLAGADEISSLLAKPIAIIAQ